MAFLKKKEGNEKSKTKISFSDVRVFAVFMFLAFVVICVLIGYGIKGTKETQASIATKKEEYAQNQLAIANLKALQSKSSEYEAQRDSYNQMVPDSQNLQEIMIEMENRVESGHLVLSNFQIEGMGEDGAASTESTPSSSLLHETRINLSIRGKYGDILQFMNEITNDTEFMRIDKVHLAPEAEDKMNAEITVVKFAKR